MAENIVELKPQVVTLVNLLSSENRSIENGLTYPLRFLNIKLHHLDHWRDLVNAYYLGGNPPPWSTSLAEGKERFQNFSNHFAHRLVDKHIKRKKELEEQLADSKKLSLGNPSRERSIKSLGKKINLKQDYVGNTVEEQQLRQEVEEERILNFIYHAAIDKHEVVYVGREFDDACKSCLRGEGKVGSHCDAVLVDLKKQGVEDDPKYSRDMMYMECIGHAIETGKLQDAVNSKRLQTLKDDSGKITGYLVTLELLFDQQFHEILDHSYQETMEKHFPSGYRK